MFENIENWLVYELEWFHRSQQAHIKLRKKAKKEKQSKKEKKRKRRNKKEN